MKLRIPAEEIRRHAVLLPSPDRIGQQPRLRFVPPNAFAVFLLIHWTI